MKNGVCVVIVTYNRKKLVVECISSLLKQSCPVDEIFLVDNASTDGTEEELKKRFFGEKKIKYILLKENIGGAGGFETGIKAAMEDDFEWIWIMDDDTIPDKNCLEKLLEGAKHVDNASFLVSNIYGVDGLPMNIPQINRKDLAENGYSNCYSKLDRKLVAIESATFVSILIRAKAIKIVGYPCGFFFIWGDDTEYTLRLSRNFGSGYLVGDSKALHKRNSNANLSIFSETSKTRIELYRYSVRNNLIIYKEYFSTPKFLYEFAKKVKLVVELIVSNTAQKKKKILVVSSGIFDFIFKKYDYKAFKKRIPR